MIEPGDAAYNYFHAFIHYYLCATRFSVTVH